MYLTRDNDDVLIEWWERVQLRKLKIWTTSIYCTRERIVIPYITWWWRLLSTFLRDPFTKQSDLLFGVAFGHCMGKPLNQNLVHLQFNSLFMSCLTQWCHDSWHHDVSNFNLDFYIYFETRRRRCLNQCNWVGRWERVWGEHYGGKVWEIVGVERLQNLHCVKDKFTSESEAHDTVL